MFDKQPQEAIHRLAEVRERNLGECGSYSRVLYRLLSTSLGLLNYASFIRPFCRRLDLATVVPPQPLVAASPNLKIFHSHLPEGQPAYEIQIPFGVLTSAAALNSSLVTWSTSESCSSSEDEDSGGRTDRPVSGSLLTSANSRLDGGVAHVADYVGEERRMGTVVTGEEEDEPNQALPVVDFILSAGQKMGAGGMGRASAHFLYVKYAQARLPR